VMMGNFLTTLGATPEEDRAMFEDLGLNIKRHADNGANPRPDNRSGYLEGETPDIVEDFIDNAEQAIDAGIKIELWDPATQLRYAKKANVPERPDGEPNRWPEDHEPDPEPVEALPFGYSAAR
jgi:biotin synthase